MADLAAEPQKSNIKKGFGGNKMNRDEIQVSLILIFILLFIVFISYKAQKEREADQKIINEYENAQNEYLIETYKDQEKNKTYKIITNKIGDVIFCEEIQPEE